MDALHAWRFMCDLKRVTIEGLVRSTGWLLVLLGCAGRALPLGVVVDVDVVTLLLLLNQSELLLEIKIPS